MLLLFVVWQLAYAPVVEGRAQASVVDDLEQQFRQTTSTPRADTGAPPEGEVFAILRVPHLGGPTWARPVHEGVGASSLAKGLGRYPTTALPGQVGNMGIAGHRVGRSNPLLSIDAISVGDVLVVETREQYAVYRAERRHIVAPTRVDVLAPVPGQPGAVPDRGHLTLTSCDPPYSSTHRFVVHAALERVLPRGDGLPSDLLTDPAVVDHALVDPALVQPGSER